MLQDGAGKAAAAGPQTVPAQAAMLSFIFTEL